MTGPWLRGIVRPNRCGEVKSEEDQDPDLTLDDIRKERQERHDADPGVKLGRDLGRHLRKSSAIILPFQMALAPILMTLLGWWIDRWVGSFPAFTLVGLVLGLISAGRAVAQAVKDTEK